MIEPLEGVFIADVADRDAIVKLTSKLSEVILSDNNHHAVLIETLGRITTLEREVNALREELENQRNAINGAVFMKKDQPCEHDGKTNYETDNGIVCMQCVAEGTKPAPAENPYNTELIEKVVAAYREGLQAKIEAMKTAKIDVTYADSGFHQQSLYDIATLDDVLKVIDSDD